MQRTKEKKRQKEKEGGKERGGKERERMKGKEIVFNKENTRVVFTHFFISRKTQSK